MVLFSVISLFKYLFLFLCIEINLNSMKKTQVSALFIAFLILSAQIAEAELIQVVNINLTPFQNSNGQGLGNFPKNNQNKKDSFQVIQVKFLENKNRGNISSQNQTTEKNILSSVNRTPSVIVNINGKSFIDIQKSKIQPKEKDSSKINFKFLPEKGQTNPINVSQALIVQNKSKVDQTQINMEEIKVGKQSSKEVVQASKPADSIKEANALKVEKQTEGVYTSDQKESKYINKIYIEDSKSKQQKSKSKSKSQPVTKETIKIQDKLEQKSKESSSNVLLTPIKTISQSSKPINSNNSTSIKDQIKSQVVLVKQPVKSQNLTETKVKEQLLVQAHPSDQKIKQEKQIKGSKQIKKDQNTKQIDTKINEYRIKQLQVEKAQQAAVEKKEVEVPKTTSELTQPLLSKKPNLLVHSVNLTQKQSEHIDQSAYPKVQQNLPSKQNQLPTKTTSQKITFKDPILSTPITALPVNQQVKQTILKDQQKIFSYQSIPKIQQKQIFIPQSETISLPKIKIDKNTSQQAKQQTSQQSVSMPSIVRISDLLQQNQHKTSNYTQDNNISHKEPSDLTSKMAQNSSVLVSTEKQLKKDNPNIFNTNPLVGDKTLNEKVATSISSQSSEQIRIDQAINQSSVSHISNVSETKVSMVNQPTENLSNNECHPGCDIYSQIPICFQQSCRRCLSDAECQSILKRASLLGSIVQGICNIDTGKCGVKQNQIQQ